jgi:hypothetical protein
LLDQLSEQMEGKQKAGVSLSKERKLIEGAIRFGLRRKAFQLGNGEKILKRLINMAKQCTAQISDSQFEEIFQEYPGLRGSLLSWWQHSGGPELKIALIAALVEDGAIVDDAALVDIAVSIVAARLPKVPHVDATLNRIVASLNQATPWGFFANSWILSKYGTESSVMRLFESSVSLWVTQEHLSRVAAGLYPRVLGSPEQARFEAILQRVGNPWTQAVHRFHEELSRGINGYNAVKSFVVAPNRSLPNKLSHAKFLMLLSIIYNPDLVPAVKANLKKVHAFGLTDQYYRELLP